jgi:hypothetical protein
MFLFDLRAQSNCENIRPTKKFVPANNVQAAAEIIRIKHFDPLAEVRRKESAMFEVAMEPERAGIKLNLIGSNAHQLVREPNVIPFFVPILRNRQRICLEGASSISDLVRPPGRLRSVRSRVS